MTNSTDAPASITRESLAESTGPVVVEFGASTCGICTAFAPHLQQLLAGHPSVRHLKVEDGRGRPLGRSFGVTLWPTFVLLKDGQVQQQLVRPSREEMRNALQRIV